MLLLDTNVISELRKVRHKRTDPNFAAWARDLHWADLYLSAITIYEIELGISHLVEYDKPQSSILRGWFEKHVLERFEHRILPVTTEIALHAAKLQRSRTRATEDTLIAATAQINSMKLATRNIQDFNDAGIEIINPWES
jgi:toxin FitB